MNEYPFYKIQGQTYLGKAFNLMQDHGLISKLDKRFGQSESKGTKTSTKT